MEEKIVYQFVMSYKAYRRKMIVTRVGLALVAAGGLAALCVVSIPLGIILPLVVLFLGAITIIFSINAERTYTVYNTRVVLKKRNDDRRVFIPFEKIKAVRCSRAFYERDLGTATVVITAETDGGKTKKYKLLHILDAAKCVGYIAENMGKKSAEE